MRKYGHYGLTLLLSIPLVIVLPILYSLPIVAMMLIMSLIPNRERPISILNRRGIMHTVVFAVFSAGVFMGGIMVLLMLVDIGIQELSGVSPAFLAPVRTAFVLSVGVFLGIISHILGDVLISGGSKPTPKPFWPVSRIPVCFGIANERHPLVNDGLLKFTIPVFILLCIVRLGITPIFFY